MHWWAALLLGLTVILYLNLLYSLVVGLPGLRGPGRPPAATRLRRFAVLVPAHDEARVLGPLLRSLEAQRYPAGLCTVYVIADNCSDDTAAVAQAHGARALVRRDPVRRGKTQAVRWALTRVPLEDYDAVALFDADNLAHPDFLASMNDYLEAHPAAEAVQGYLETKNPDDTWITKAYALSYWYSNRFWQLARAHWGLSASLGGTGFVLRSAALRRLGWEIESLTDDLELTARIVLGGGRVHWNDHAVTYDEKPLTLAASLRQRTRWMRGHYWVLWRYGPAALAALLRTRRWQYADLLLLLGTPVFFAAGYLAMAGSWAAAASGAFAEPGAVAPWAAWIAPVGATLGFAQMSLQMGAAPLLRTGRWNPGVLLMTLPLMLYGLTWAVPVFRAIFQAHDQGGWNKTEHTRALQVEELDAGPPGGSSPDKPAGSPNPPARNPQWAAKGDPPNAP